MTGSSKPCKRLDSSAFLIVIAAALAGCGIRGPLTLPEPSKAAAPSGNPSVNKPKSGQPPGQKAGVSVDSAAPL